METTTNNTDAAEWVALQKAAQDVFARGPEAAMRMMADATGFFAVGQVFEVAEAMAAAAVAMRDAADVKRNQTK